MPLPRRPLLAAAVPGALALPAPARAALLEPSLRLAQPEGRALVLTLDLCPGGFDARIAGFLAAEKIPATVFVSGEWLRRNPEPLGFLLAHPDVFDLQNHGERHLAAVLGGGRAYGLPLAGDEATLRREVAGGAALLTEACGRPPRWFRGAGGLYDRAALELIRAMGFAVGGFSLNADQGAGLPAATVAARLAAAPAGAVVLAHGNQPRRPAGEGVVAGVARLRAEGARFLTLGALAPGDFTLAF